MSRVEGQWAAFESPVHGVSGNYVALTGLPSRTRAVWAQVLAAEYEWTTATDQSELWAELRRCSVDGERGGWALESTAPLRPQLAIERDIAGVAAVVSGFTASAWSRQNICATSVALAASELLRGHPELRVLVLYQPPWEAFHESCKLYSIRSGDDAAAWLRYWLGYHEAVLAAHAQDPGRIFLVNASHLEPHAGALLEMLREEGIAVPDAAFAGLSKSSPGPAAGLLARQMSDMAPEYWDTYESLETSALLFGRDPEFRFSALSEPTEGLPAVLGIWCDAFAAQEMELENGLLVRQLRQMQEELEHYSASNESMASLLKQSREIADRARVVISNLAS